MRTTATTCLSDAESWPWGLPVFFFFFFFFWGGVLFINDFVSLGSPTTSITSSFHLVVRPSAKANPAKEVAEAGDDDVARRKRDLYVGIGLVLVFCCLNVIVFELIISSDPGGGNLITLGQFAFVTIQALPSQVRCRCDVLSVPEVAIFLSLILRLPPPFLFFSFLTRRQISWSGFKAGKGLLRKRNIPLSSYVVIVALFFLPSLANNKVWLVRENGRRGFVVGVLHGNFF